MTKLSDKEILAAWRENVRPWIAAIEKGEIATRVLVTNQAIVDAVMAYAPRTVLDVGCGEGWLVRALVDQGVDALGVDAIPEFISAAQAQGVGRFKVLSYEDTCINALQEQFDLVVCNFSLLGEDAVANLIQVTPSLLNEQGVLIVQTIHPRVGCGAADYADGWREGSWAGFSANFGSPAPWYFRTIESWLALFKKSGFYTCEILEPNHPNTNEPASIIFCAKVGW